MNRKRKCNDGRQKHTGGKSTEREMIKYESNYKQKIRTTEMINSGKIDTRQRNTETKKNCKNKDVVKLIKKKEDDITRFREWMKTN